MASFSEKSIFLAALEKRSAQERETFLAEACAGDDRLQAELKELLRAHDLRGNPLDQVPEEVGAVRAHLEAVQGVEPDATSSASADDPSMTKRRGAIIGRYRLMELIGEGGFGLVFVAEQQSPVRRRVALKVMKPGVDTREVIARFEAERQALALMDHPNIARVLDAGATETGRPYFVMELVRGIPITEFCDQNLFTTRERLELFAYVCNAVQHAHQKGIIHRDLKPSNVLVTLHDGTAVVKVIDFGVAKAIGQQLTDKTVYTRFAQMIGTPLYMSPEQAEMSGLDIDTRSDIYSLGVLLYELLAGTTPFDRRRMQTAAFDDLRRIIREEEPPRPSTRLTTPGQALSTISANRKVEPRKLSAILRGDLDWIVMKALDKDRSRRYETAAAFAADVRRFLTQEPVEARPPSPLYRFHKFARRNKIALTTASLVIAALVLGTAVSSWQAVRARSAQAEADTLRKDAEDFADRLKEANVLLDSARAHADEGRWALAHEQYTRAAELQPDHYLVWSGRGSLYLRLGLWQQAATDYARALELGAPANNPGWWGIPQLLWYGGDEQGYRTACTRMLKQVGESPDSFFNIFAIRSCLTAPTPVTDPNKLLQQAERLLIGAPNGPRGPMFVNRRPPEFPQWRPTDGSGRRSHPPHPGHIHNYVTGLAHYRAGHMEQAIDRLSDSLNADPWWPASAVGYPALAMAHHRSGQVDLAHQSLESAQQAIDKWTEQMLQGAVGSIPIPWFDWLECLCLYHEATTLVTSATPSDDPRLRAIEDRALAVIDL